MNYSFEFKKFCLTIAAIIFVIITPYLSDCSFIFCILSQLVYPFIIPYFNSDQIALKSKTSALIVNFALTFFLFMASGISLLIFGFAFEKHQLIIVHIIAIISSLLALFFSKIIFKIEHLVFSIISTCMLSLAIPSLATYLNQSTILCIDSPQTLLISSELIIGFTIAFNLALKINTKGNSLVSE